ncbi:MAG: restriction endonuclease subunit S [Candidatus Omnitrophica bacterium]|nr:restriction endonuclease subunit S [Candidatus Omnitrophota bacterium]
MKQLLLKNCATITAGQGAPQREDDFDLAGMPFVRAGSLEELIAGRGEDCLEKVTKDAVKRYRLKLFPSGTVLFAKSGMSATKDRVYNLKQPAYVVSHLAAITPSNVLDSDYLMYFLRFFRPSRLIKDPSYPSIGLSDVERIKINDLDISHQKEVAQLLRKVELIIEKRRQTLRLADRFLKSAFLEMFGDPTKRYIQFKSVLGDYLKVLGGYAFKSTEFEKRGIPVIKIGTVNKGCFDIYTCSFMPFNARERYCKFIIKPFDLLISLTGTTGKEDYGNVCIVTAEYSEYLLNQRVGKLQIEDKKLNPIFLYYYLKHPYIKQNLTTVSRGVRQANISNEDIMAIKLDLPPEDKQQKFADLVLKVEKYKEKLKQSETQLQSLFNSLMQKAFKGELF